MNLAWIAAVLRPHVIVPRSYENLEYSSLPESQLAAIVAGDMGLRGWRTRQMISNADGHKLPEIDPSIQNVERSLNSANITEGVYNLRVELLESRPLELARSCALGLLTCSAAAELDDYETCETILDRLLNLPSDGSSETMLVRAILLQQRSLRSRDSGRPDLDLSAQAVELLDRIDVSNCQPFRLAPHVAEPYTETLNHIIAAVRDAARSFLPRTVNEKTAYIPESEQILRIDRDRAFEYATFVDNSYQGIFRTGERIIIGSPAEPELFQAALALELLAHIDVYDARKELAQMRLVQGATESVRVDLGDAIRLLRHAGALRELDWAVEWLRSAGPLTALSEDARQILRQRLTPEMLRTGELRVLQAASEILTPVEARLALDVLFETNILIEGPTDAPRHHQVLMARLEAAWMAAAALANSAGQVDRVAEFLLNVVLGWQHDDMLDRTVGRVLLSLEWRRLDIVIAERWSDWLSRGDKAMPRTEEVARIRLRQPMPEPDDPQLGLTEIAEILNASRGESFPAGMIGSAKEAVRSGFVRIREAAARGSFSGGGVSPATIAAVLIGLGEAQDLWRDLAEFLTDVAVQRDDRSAALDRLAQQLPPIPPEIGKLFLAKSEHILFSRQPSFMAADESLPYAAALRFLARYGLINDTEVLALVGQLAGSGKPRVREEAARTVATLAPGTGDIWLMAFAIQLSHDPVVGVKANAGRALAVLASTSPELASVASSRVVELLRVDGMLVPLLIIRSLDPGLELPEAIKLEIARLASDHPSRLVRVESAQVLASD